MKGNLVGVVAPTEWEAIRAAQQVAGAHEVDGLEGAARQRKLFRVPAEEDADWKTAPVTKSDKSKGDVAPALGAAAKKLSATYSFRT